MTHRRAGFVLVLALLALAAITAIAAGLLIRATHEAWIAGAEEEALRSRLTAESAVRALIADWQGEDFRELAVGEQREVAPAAVFGDSPYQTTVERLAGPLYLVRGRSGGVEAERSAAAVVRDLEPIDLWRAFPASVTTAGMVSLADAARIDGFTPGDVAATADSSCAAAAVADVIEAFGAAERPALGTLEPDSSLPLPPLGWADLAAMADVIVDGISSTLPINEDGACVAVDPPSDGAPATPGYPCGAYVPLIYAAGDLEIAGGTGPGVLVVAGDLRLTGDARFLGVAIVGGGIHLRDHAEILGAVRVPGRDADATLAGEARIAYDPCAIAMALRGSRPLGRPLRPGRRLWLPAF